MTTTRQGGSGGWFSKLAVMLLLALAIGLYLQIVMVDGGVGETGPGSPASIAVVEGAAAPAPSAAGEAADEGGELEALPAEQMELVRRVFAPELAE